MHRTFRHRLAPALLATAALAGLTAASASAEGTAPSPGVAPAGLTRPLVTGTKAVGGTLTSTNGTWSGSTPMSFAKQWLRCASVVPTTCSEIGGATGATYVPVADDRGTILRLRVTATNAKASVAFLSEPTPAIAEAGATAPVNTVAATATGTATVGSKLTAGTGTWTGSEPISFAPQWLRCTTTAASSCHELSTARGSTYTLIGEDAGRYLRVRITAGNSRGSASSLSAAVGPIAARPVAAPVSLTAPSISGTARRGSLLTASPGTFSGGQPIGLAYAWATCARGATTCVYSGATGATLVVPAVSDGTRFVVVVTATNAAGHVTVHSASTGTPALAADTLTITGTPPTALRK